MRQIIDDLGVGRHEVIPDFLHVEEPDEVADQALGLMHVPNQPYRLRFRQTQRIVERDGDRYDVVYRTPVGDITTSIIHTEQMRRDGVTLLHTTEHAVKSIEDYEVIAFLFEDIEVVPGGRYQAFQADVGDDGVAVALANVAASPVHHLLKELVPYDEFYFNLNDCPEVIGETAERMSGFFHDVVDACARSSAEVILLGANYDVMLTPPPFFEEHIAPFLTEATDTLHEAGKLVATHTDGENEGLLDLYVQCGIDLADSVCPSPMTNLPLAAYREAFGSHPAIWGGICSASVLPESFTDAEFEAHLEDVIDAAGDFRGIVYSIADTTPPDASIDRIRRIGEELGRIDPSL
ncbi:MAG: hypothetical protein GF393_01870 [Armatimonadia bacterium]|nr:hypothetical protein [Armatimonadia bacterium]